MSGDIGANIAFTIPDWIILVFGIWLVFAAINAVLGVCLNILKLKLQGIKKRTLECFNEAEKQ